MLNERQDGFINELKETYEKLNEQLQPNGNFNFVDVSVFQDYADKFKIRKQEILAENKAVRDGYMEVFLRDIDMLAEDLQSIGVVIEFGKSSDSLIKYPRNVYLRTPRGSNLLKITFLDEWKGNHSEDVNLPDSLVGMFLRDGNGCRSTDIKALVEHVNFQRAIKNYLRVKE